LPLLLPDQLPVEFTNDKKIIKKEYRMALRFALLTFIFPKNLQ
jgi:hypothetical protein